MDALLGRSTHVLFEPVNDGVEEIVRVTDSVIAGQLLQVFWQGGCVRKGKTILQNRDDVSPCLDGMSDLPAQPVVRLPAALQAHRRQDQQEVRRLLDLL